MSRIDQFFWEFVLGLLVLPLAALGACGISFVLLITIVGPALWLVACYVFLLLATLRCIRARRFGFVAAVIACFAGWAIYAEWQKAASKAELQARVAKDSVSFPSHDADAVVLDRGILAFNSPICGPLCAELLLKKVVATVFVTERNETHALTLGTSASCAGRSLEASKVLYDNNLFDLCIQHANISAEAVKGLRYTTSLEWQEGFGRNFGGSVFQVQHKLPEGWVTIFERRRGQAHTIAHVPTFIANAHLNFFFGGVSPYLSWWRYETKYGAELKELDAFSKAFGVELTLSFPRRGDEERGTPLKGSRTSWRAAPENLTEIIDKMSQQKEASVRKSCVQHVQRFLEENRAYRPIRTSILRLLTDSDRTVRRRTIDTLIRHTIVYDDELLEAVRRARST